MLDILRTKTRSFVIYLLFSIIIVVFVFTFNTITPGQACGGSGVGATVGTLAEVGDHEVDANWLNVASELTIDPPSPAAKDLNALQRSYVYRSSRFYNLRIPSPFADFGPDPAFTSPIEIEKAMFDLVETMLVAEQAEKAGLAVSDRELTDRLVGDPSWYDADTGEFKRSQYESYVRFQVGTSPARFEQLVRMELLREKMIALVTGALEVTEAELRFHHVSSGEKVDLAVAVLDDEAAAGLVKVDEAAVQGYLAAHGDDVRKYYDEHPDEFRKPERVSVRGIQVKAPNRAVIELEEDAEKKKGLVAERDAARAKAQGVLDGLKTKAAETPAEPAPAPAEGAVPTEGAGSAEAKAAPAAEGAAADVAEPPAAPAPGTVPIEVFAEAVTASSDHAASKDAGGLFPEPRSREEMGRWPFGAEAVEATFALAPGQVTDLVEVDSGFWILRLEEKLPAVERSFEEARIEIAEKLHRKEKAPELKKALADEVLAEAKKDPKKPLADVVAAVNAAHGVAADGGGLVVSRTGSFARLPEGATSAAQFGRIPLLGEAPALVKGAFDATEESPLVPEVVSLDEGARLVVAQVAAWEHPEAFDASKLTTVRDALLREKQKSFYRAWFEDLLTRAVKEGEVSFTAEWKEMLKTQLDAWRTAGGTQAASTTP